MNEGRTAPYYHTPKEKSVYECLIKNKDICDTWEQKELEFDNSYVKSYADKIDFNKYFWFFEENSLHLFGGIIEWSIRNFDYNIISENIIKLFNQSILINLNKTYQITINK